MENTNFQNLESFLQNYRYDIILSHDGNKLNIYINGDYYPSIDLRDDDTVESLKNRLNNFYLQNLNERLVYYKSECEFLKNKIDNFTTLF